MRHLVLIAVVITGTVARPETYKEKEDFQYSRSSSDDGSKSGYYGAQRGNMGGNYERAHNMDSVAQHQMSGLIHQVEGEIGDTSNTNAGSVYTAANSRGMYGSGHYDLSNLEGRNFQEGTSYGNSHSQNALTNSAYRNHASGSNGFSNSNSYSHSSRHSSLDRTEQEQREEIQSSNLRSGESAYQHEHGASSQGYSWSPYQNRLVSTRPMRILLRPGSKTTVPIATQTYDANHSASTFDASAYNHDAAKSDAEIIINNDHETSGRQVPTSKHYESSYSYRKEWEKHHSSPGAVPLGVDIDGSIPKTSELYDDSQHAQTYNNQHQNQYTSNAADTHSHHSSNLYGYNSRSNLASSSQSKQQLDYGVQRESERSSDLNALNTQQSNLNQDYANQQGSVNSKPKSYQSSYSYHKSWERQGDPYVIVPVPDVQNSQASQRLSTASNSHSGYSSHQYGSNRKQSHQSYTSSNGLMDCDCDEEGHIRVARSYNTDQEGQQQQNGWDDFGQQSQNLWDGQQSQNQWDKIEDLGQQTQTQFDKIEDLGQQSQNQWDKIEDLGQQTQTQFDKIEDLGQQSQNQWDKIEDLGQQTQTQFDKIEDLGQHSQNQWDQSQYLGQQSQNQWDKIEDLGQQTQTQFDKIEDLGQHSQNNKWDKYNQFDQQSQSNVDQEQATWNKLAKSHEDTLTHETNRDQSYSNSNTLADDVTHYTDKQVEIGHKEQTVEQNYFYTHLPNDYHTQHTGESLSDSRTQQTSSINSLWDKLDRLSGESSFSSDHNTNENTSLIENEHQNDIAKESTTTENILVTEKNVVHPKDSGRGDIPDSTVVHPKNIGRGDIPDTPEGFEFLKHSSTTEKINVVSTTTFAFDKINKTRYGTLRDIEALSLTGKRHEITEKPKEESDKTNMDNKMDIVHQQIEHSSNSHNVNHRYQGKQVIEENYLPRTSENVYKEIIIDNQTSTTSENYNQQNINHHNDRFDHQTEDLYQQNMPQETQKFEKPVEIFDQQNLDQNLVDFSKFNENIDQHSINHHLDDSDEQIHQKQQTVDQQTQHLEKPAEIVDQQNLDQNSLNFSEWNENLDHHSMNHQAEGYDQQNQQNVEQGTQYLEKPFEIEDQQNLVDFGKWNENLDQQSMNHHPEGFDQQNQQNMEQEMQTFDKPGDSFGQQNFNQNLVDFSQFSENAHQQSTHQLSESFHQHSQNLNQNNMEQELQSFDKLSDSFDQQNLNGNFDQQNLSGNFDQQNLNGNFDQQNHYYGFNSQNSNHHQRHMEQESQNFEKHIESFNQQNFNQNLEDFSKLNENFDQQTLSHHFARYDGQKENLEQKNTDQELQNFDKPIEIFDQQNLNQNLDELSLFHEKFDQQHTNQGSQDFRKPEDSFDQQQHQNNDQQFDFGIGRENYDQQFHQKDPKSEIVQKHVAENNLEHSEMQQNSNKLLSIQQTEQHTVSQSTLPPEQEQTGFWASVGKKFTSAKDKVSSWFRKKSD